MAERLRRAGYLDGAVFHAYHAYLAAAGLRVPASHGGRLIRFDAVLDPNGAIAAEYQRLDLLPIRVRNESLYYETDGDLLPHDRFDEAFVERLMPVVHAFAQAVWREIR